MKKLNPGDLAVFYTDNPDATQYNGCIVLVVELVEEFMYYDYFVQFPDGRVLEAEEHELQSIFST